MGNNTQRNEYQIEELRQMMDLLSRFFYKVRLVDPISCAQLAFTEEGTLSPTEKCYLLWGQDSRCQNCISRQASANREQYSKFELIEDQMYYIISTPIEVCLPSGECFPCVLELITRNFSNMVLSALGKNSFIENVLRTEEELYIDPLTGAFNRRYFEERAFCFGQLPCELLFIVLDLKNFKKINDNYGHPVGDQVLTDTVHAFKRNLRSTDAVVRMGGDEFLIILKQCKPDIAKKIMNKIKDDMIANVIYDASEHKYASVNYGISYIPEFDGSDECINHMYLEADQNMYKEKKSEELSSL